MMIKNSIVAASALALASGALAQDQIPNVPPPAAGEPAAPPAAPADAAAPTTAAVPAVTPPPPISIDPDALGNRLAPPKEGKGQIVLFRRGTIMGAAVSCATFENGAKVSSLSPGRYFVLEATPGIHSYAVRSEATDVLRLEIEPGETYFVECKVGMGAMSGRPNLTPSDAAGFNARVRKLKPVETKP